MTLPTFDKELYTTSNSFGLLRKELIEHLGHEHAKTFLLRYGWNLGVAHAKEVDRMQLRLREKLDCAATYHLNTGQITDLVTERVLDLDEYDNIKEIYAKGIWIDSYEASEHLQHFGMSKHVACHTLAGYASGFTSYLTKKEIYIIEVTCRARGDAECAFEMKALEDWDKETQSYVIKMNHSRMIDELNTTYEQLYQEKRLTELVSIFHNNLTKGLTQGMKLEQLLETVHETLHTPVVLQDLNLNPYLTVGITLEELDGLYEDFAKQVGQTRSGKLLLKPIEPEHPLQIDAKEHTRLVCPITVHHQVIGYVTFIYPPQTKQLEFERDFIQRVGTTCSLHYLNEKSSLEAIENMKAYFFEQLLQKQYTSKSSMVNRSYLMDIDLNQYFFIGNVKMLKSNLQIKEQHLLSKVIQTFAIYLEMHKIPIFITQYQDEIIFLMQKQANTIEIAESILKHLQRSFKIYDFRIGISRVIEDIEDIPEAHQQSIIALNVDKKKPIVLFENTSIISSIINAHNKTSIIQLAKHELKAILELKESKKVEFLKTLYTFLKNNGNLQQTMFDLNLSMSGLVYRIQKLEDLLNKNLRNSKDSFELTFCIEALEILGEVEIE
ncbi:V4R domain-containing protein [Psychrobacillus sp. NPDC096623]|uniref:V4R domain-containing protein n=1 Tax=Psychrobacillus sp. NPDC096623 TaxID=3364492 RepID=UPI003809DFB2